MLLIVGLGNPGRRYANNRHNIGFMAADEIFRRYHFSPWRARFQGEVAEGTIDGTKVLILKPATFMNKSGQSVGEAVRFYKIDPSDVLVLYDELDLPPGKIRIKLGGSASHNGIRSIVTQIGPHFRRLRLGIGHPGHRDLVNAHVLRDFSKADKDWLTPLIGDVAEYTPLLVANDDAGFMNKMHLAMSKNSESAQAKSVSSLTAESDTANSRDSDSEQTKAPRRPEQSKSAKLASAGRSGPLAEGLKRLFGRSNLDGRK